MVKIMNKEEIIQNLYKETENILRKNKFEIKQTLSYKDIYNQLEDLHRQKIELEVQNQHLSNAFSELETLYSKYMNLYDFIPLGFVTLNEKGTIIEINEAGTKLLGLKKNEILNRASLLRYIAVDSQATFAEHCEILKNDGGTHTCEIRLLRRNGPIFPAEITSKQCINRITGDCYLFVFITDITERKATEFYLHENQNKLATFDRSISVEKFASVIAHEMKHPLTIISNYLYGCIRYLESGNFNIPDILHAMKKATKHSQRAGDVILRIKNFTCKGKLELESICLNYLIQEVITLIQYEINSFPVNLLFCPCAQNINVVVDKIHLEQAVLNLARNSIEAMRDANTEDARIKIEINHIEKEKVEIRIEDNGPGIPEKTKHQIFDPHFTTKTYGIGLGLAVSKNIIESHGGQLEIDNHGFNGAAFKIILPVESSVKYKNKANKPSLAIS